MAKRKGRKKGGRKRRASTKGRRPRLWGRSGTHEHPHRPRILGSPGHFRSSSKSPWHHYRVNPHLLREVGMMYGNPRHRGRRHHYGNPGGGMVGEIQGFMRSPMDHVMSAAATGLGAFGAIALPNWLLPFPGNDIMSRLIRLATRLAAAGLITGFAPARYRSSVRDGAMLGAVGSSIFDFMGTRIIIGAGDTGQTPMALVAPLTTTAAAPAATAAYARLRAYSAPMLPAARHANINTMGAVPDFPARGLVRHNLF